MHSFNGECPHFASPVIVVQRQPCLVFPCEGSCGSLPSKVRLGLPLLLELKTTPGQCTEQGGVFNDSTGKWQAESKLFQFLHTHVHTHAHTKSEKIKNNKANKEKNGGGTCIKRRVRGN